MSAISEWILGSGPSNAKLLAIGEAPGKNEDQQKKNFVGPSGELLTEMFEVAGIKRSSVYITNVVKIRPPNNDLEKLNTIFNESTGKYYEIQDFLPLLFNEIEAIQPNCILAIGSLALKTLTGKDGIKNWRGSILPIQNFSSDSSSQFSRTYKVIPTIHPAALFDRSYSSQGQGMFSWKQKAHIQFDILKAAREKDFPGFDSIPVRNLEIIRSSLALENFFNLYKDYKRIYIDTEVLKSHLVCIGFAFTRYHGVSIPLVDLQDNENHRGIALHELVEIWRIVARELARKDTIKCGQNFKADKVYWLEKSGFVVNGRIEDGMYMIHSLSPEFPKSLAFQQSIYTNEPFHKNEGKEYNPRKDKIDDLLRYNAKDCVVNCECMEEEEKDIDELGLREVYEKFMVDMYPIYEGIEKRGWKVDLQKKKELFDFYTEELRKEIAIERDLLGQLGIEEDEHPPDKSPYNFNSPDKVDELIYIRMRCPRRKDTSDQTLTALMNNAVKDVRKKRIIECKLNERSIYKLRGNYCGYEVDYDGRARYQYKQHGTETFRTSTGIIEKPLRTGKWGLPIQTTPRPDEFGGRIREQFIADEGKILIEVDQSQAEARLVAVLAEDYELLKLFDSLPYLSKLWSAGKDKESSWDLHKLTASFVYGLTTRSGQDLINTSNAGLALHSFDCFCPPCIKLRSEYDFDLSFLDLVDDFQRQIGKNTRHGCAYALGEEGLSIKMKISLYRAKQAYLKVHEMSPKIKSGFQEGIQEALASNNKVLMSPFGRRREFFGRWGDELFREAYAHIPQTTIGDNTKRCMWGLIYTEKVDWIEFLEEGHDSFVAQISIGREKEAYGIIKHYFEEPITFEKCTIKREPLIIPTDCKIGFSWGSMKKFKGE